MQSLAGLRLRLTAWYAGIFVSILALLGGGLFFAIRHRMSQQLDASLRGATSALMQAARIREAELASAKGVVADAVDELHIPDRSRYRLAEGATPVRPAEAPDWIRDAAREAERAGAAHREREAQQDHILRLYAERFTGANGTVYVAAAVADRLELEYEYASLIRAFAAAALAALLLVAGDRAHRAIDGTDAPVHGRRGPRAAHAHHAAPDACRGCRGPGARLDPRYDHLPGDRAGGWPPGCDRRRAAHTGAGRCGRAAGQARRAVCRRHGRERCRGGAYTGRAQARVGGDRNVRGSARHRRPRTAPRAFPHRPRQRHQVHARRRWRAARRVGREWSRRSGGDRLRHRHPGR